MKFHVRVLFLALAALFLIGSIVTIGMNIRAALADHDFSLPTLSLTVIFVVIFILIVLVFRNWRRSEQLSRYCRDCALRY